MRIESARDLKLEVLTEVLPGLKPEIVSSLSIGIAPGACVGDYRLAIRTGVRTDVGNVLDQINKRAVNETDIKSLARIQATDVIPPMTPSRILRLGASVGHFLSRAGTLGFFARRLNDDALGFVSCNHVLAAEDQGAEGDEILHPGPADSGQRPDDVVGYLDGEYPRLRQPAATMDCAFARLSDTAPCELSHIGHGEMLRSEGAVPQELNGVQKVGRTTGRTRGRETAFELDGVDVQYEFGPAVFSR